MDAKTDGLRLTGVKAKCWEQGKKHSLFSWKKWAYSFPLNAVRDFSQLLYDLVPALLPFTELLLALIGEWLGLLC